QQAPRGDRRAQADPRRRRARCVRAARGGHAKARGVLRMRVEGHAASTGAHGALRPLRELSGLGSEPGLRTRTRPTPAGETRREADTPARGTHAGRGGGGGMSMSSVRATAQWVDVCELAKLPADRGVCALVGQEQVAVFRISPNDDLFAIANYDPFSRANVLSRGIVGSKGDVLKVASPVYKHAFCLCTGSAPDGAP